MRDIKKIINKANILKDHEEYKSLNSFMIDDDIYKLSKSAIADIEANAKDGRVYFRDLQTPTLIEIANS